MKALPKILLALTGVAALSLAYPGSVQAVPTTYQYTGNTYNAGNPFVPPNPYTESMFVTAMVTFAGPLHANTSLHQVHPTAFTFFDGVQTITNLNSDFSVFKVATNASGIKEWLTNAFIGTNFIETANTTFIQDTGRLGEFEAETVD